MQVNPERRAPDDNPDMAERRRQVSEEREPVVLLVGRGAAGRLGKQRLGQVAQVPGLLRGRDEVVHQRVRLDEREQRVVVTAQRLAERGRVGDVGVIERS